MRPITLPLLAASGLLFGFQSESRADFFQNNLSVPHELVASDRFLQDPSTDYGFEAVDKFNNVSVNSATQTLKITWWGAAADVTIPGDTFGVRMYGLNGPANDPGTPPAQGLFFATMVNPTATYLGTIDNPSLDKLHLYRYEAILSIAPDLAAGTEYFLSLYEADNDTDPGHFNDRQDEAWQWMSAVDLLPGEEFHRDFELGNAGNWHPNSANDVTGRAFSLETISLTAVPEPSTLALLGLVGGLGAYRRRRQLKKQSAANAE